MRFNEAIEDDGSYRNSFWNKAMNREFIAKAFTEAKKNQPRCCIAAQRLWYRDECSKV